MAGIIGQGNIVKNGLILNLDAANPRSYAPPYDGVLWRDLSGINNNGTLVNGPTFDSGNGGGIVFDGVNDHITLASNPVLTNQITVEVWVNLNSPLVQTYGMILGRESSYRLIYTTSTFEWVCSTVNNGWYSTGTLVTTSASTTSGIYHVVGTYNGLNNRIYVNGVLRNTGGNISGNILTSGTYGLFRTVAGNVSYGRGRLYSHRIYNRALSATEILQNFNATRGRYGI